ncbi:hypothetical protein D9619_006491 [Psilocybe cf. subviscida]|uniref:Cytochrome P450 n=1 Tax=Psilocybe cf. subviscida TaxID=2480587 RepID=A0A8H5EY51_9AGAR|nr:hypothetical protein D9619_006491 [Psilocybe cf. subviscida]
MEDQATHPYANALKGFIPTAFKLRFVFPLMPFFSRWGSAKFRRFVVDVIPWKALRETRDLVDIMTKTSCDIYEEKKKALADGDKAFITKVGQGKDIMSILMRANMSASKEDSLTEEELLGQMSSLIFAAMDTTSNALSRILYLLATHPEVQDRLRRELAEAKENNGDEDVPYDKLGNVATAPSGNECAEDGLDGKEMHEIHVPEGTHITVAILAANRNPDVWGPDAEEWKPDRWLAPLPESVINAHLPGIYSHLGFKFSQLEMKAVLFTLVENFRFSPSQEEIIWEMNGITSPNVKGRNSKVPIMSMLVERI